MSINDILDQSKDANVEDASDFLGGGGFIKDSDVYLMRVIHAFVEESAKGAFGINLHMKHADDAKTEFNTTVYITSGKEKGQKTYYEKNGKQFPLPGFTTIEDMCRIASNGKQGILDANKSKKVLEVYDFTAGKKVNKEVEIIDTLTKQVFKIALLKTLNNKFKDKKPTSETIERNEISVVLSRDEKTLREINAGANPVFMQKWLEKNKGVVKDNRTIVAEGGSKFAGKSDTAAVDAKVSQEDDELFAD